MTAQAFALLCALATLSCVAGAVRAAHALYVAGGMLFGVVLLQPDALRLPFAPLVTVEPTQVALLLVLFALARLRGHVPPRLALSIGGLLAVIWFQALRATGWPSAFALPFVLGIVALAFGLGRRRTFYPATLQDDVALFVLAGGLLVALVPEIVGGWNSAQVLQGAADAAAAGSADVVWVAAGFVVLGAVFAWWKSKRRWKR